MTYWKKLSQKKLWMIMGLLVTILLNVAITNATATAKIKSTHVALNATKVTLSVGDIASLTAHMQPLNATDSLSWKSSDKAVATVNQYGAVTAKKEGEAVITVKTSNKKTATCKVTVKKLLTESEVDAMIKEKIEAGELGNQNLSEDVIKGWISSSTLTREEIEKLVHDEVAAAKSWPDNTSLSMLAGQKLPLYINDSTRLGIVGSITSIQVRKRHMTSNFIYKNESRFFPYRYDVILTANVNVISDAQKEKYFAKITLGAPNVPDLEQVPETFSFSYAGNNLTEIISFYSCYDVDEFFIDNARWESK